MESQEVETTPAPPQLAQPAPDSGMPLARGKPVRRRWLVIATLVAGGLCLCGCLAIWLASPVIEQGVAEFNAIRATLDDFMVAMAEDDIAGATRLFVLEGRAASLINSLRDMGELWDGALFDGYRSLHITSFYVNMSGGEGTRVTISAETRYSGHQGQFGDLGQLDAELVRYGDNWLLIDVNVKRFFPE
jgi:hypothetical protein